jgi:hypothetical protein
VPSFVIRGQVYGQPVAASWNDGTVSLSDALQRAVDFFAAHTATVEATPTGPAFPVGLAGWEQAYLTIRAALDVVSAEDGDLPRWPLPAGAIG